MSAASMLRAFTGQTYLGDPAGHYWAKLSTTFLADASISDAEKIALTAIVSLSSPAGLCQASNAELGERCGKNEKTFANLAKRLEIKGLITREPNGPRRSIRLNFSFRGKAERDAYPPRSEGVDRPATPPDVGGHPPRTEGVPPRKRGATPAPARAILRWEDSKKELPQDRPASSAEVVQGPPPPPTEGGGEIPSVDGLPEPSFAALPTPLRALAPVDRPAETRYQGERFVTRPAAREWPEPINSGDILPPDRLDQAVRGLRAHSPGDVVYGCCWIAVARNAMAAKMLLMRHRTLPAAKGGPIVLDMIPRDGAGGGEAAGRPALESGTAGRSGAMGDDAPSDPV